VRAPSGWQRNVWALSLSVFIAFVGFQFFSPFLPLYVRELGVTDPSAIALWSGVLAAVTPTVSGFLAPLFGRLADRFGRKMMLIRSLAGFTVIIAAMGLVTSVWQLFASRASPRWRWPWPACRRRARRWRRPSPACRAPSS
jgi:MFS transporter, DHA1 family, multidrug resistance protein